MELPADAIAATAAPKQPPPEKPEAIRVRTRVVFSFWAVILLLGLPTWWKTTSIYRAELPLQEMLNWAEGSNAPSAYPLHIWISAPEFPCDEAQFIVHEIQKILDDMNEYPILHQRLHLVDPFPVPRRKEDGTVPISQRCGGDRRDQDLGEPALKLLIEPASAFKFDLETSTTTALAHIPSNAVAGEMKDLAQALYQTFRFEQIAAALYTVASTTQNQNAQAFLKSQPYEIVTSVEKQINRAYKSSPDFHLTFSLFAASGAPSSWDIQAALQNHIQPLTRALSKTANFEITTQIQLYSAYSPAIHPVTDDSRNGTLLQQKDLTAFVNAAEWPLAPSIGDGPTINFILYVPSRDQVPLGIAGLGTTSWLIPQWGGIQILNPVLTPNPMNDDLTLPHHLSAGVLDKPFEIVAAQLLSLLGISNIDELGSSLPLHLRLGAYNRLSALTLYLRAASSLGSLSRLAQHLNNIPIPKNVAQLVDDTIGNLTACSQAFLGSQWHAALSHAKSAYMDSEKAFFDKSMVGQVYFPDEHKVAVYLPLLGPIGLPLLVGLLRELKRLATKTTLVDK
ncbi:uncharacterized protein A1O9_01074 [Exophiala aquamarina CBS 119918]|uniref:Phosphatidylinositol glycan, class S n=1 Tax=Exophiala aquamarina CBS 119918 TaxID=1182545 RepID=A0A072PUQ6_9EURO|nr:uncharacterized protein A1O9_01074 [Exophiala aquamarina CBS 119918]KEF63098.1 hypothetical protein A1O9_01074 [Exophiala aquamarina CBS 119918]